MPVPQQRQCVLRDHELFIGRHDVDRNSAARARYPRAWRAFSTGSSDTPSHSSRSAILARMPTEFSPIPAVKTKPSRPCKAAASIPACSATL